MPKRKDYVPTIGLFSGILMDVIATERLLLRYWRDSDREPFAILNADPRVMEFMPGTLSHEESDRLMDRIRAHFRQHGFGLFATELRQDDAFIGFIGLSI